MVTDQTPPPTPESAYVLFIEALSQANQKLSPDYQVFLIGQIVNQKLVKRDEIFKSEEIDQTEPVYISMARVQSTAGKIWDWCRSFFTTIPPKGAALSIVNVITDRTGKTLRNSETIAKVIIEKVHTYNDSLANPKKYISLGNGALIKETKDISVKEGIIYIDGIPVVEPAVSFHSEKPMVFERIEKGVLRLGDPGDSKPFYFHPDKKVRNKLKVFRSPDLSD
ncbi:MAG: hypothetical protein SNF33_06280 [Candidatus Algichlamydia australiensis]|nr:hypothetical protein [Chlamydiales bacterium]